MRDRLSIFCKHDVCSQKQQQRYQYFGCSLELIIFNSITNPKCCSDDPLDDDYDNMMTLISPFEHVPLDALKGCRIAHHKFIAALITHFLSQSANFQD